ncbi:hypothetical protein [Halostagnicola sp. A-GB9-2]|uniref:hypothetical protein n=1 Tax=Halostagnicola sp. A-GB9-2 TaxID=3048066 RepID=UPI0024C0C980|nr:hypothetical protein [Halostagnicola sp. A-GB9-2]MDJ1433930.1 hypothetical protein [Halostagnicola sp. A-GB9-2]
MTDTDARRSSRGTTEATVTATFEDGTTETVTDEADERHPRVCRRDGDRTDCRERGR